MYFLIFHYEDMHNLCLKLNEPQPTSLINFMLIKNESICFLAESLKSPRRPFGLFKISDL